MQENLKKISLRSMMKIEGSGSAGSISQRHGSADPDPDPHQNVMDPQHCLQHSHQSLYFSHPSILATCSSDFNSLPSFRKHNENIIRKHQYCTCFCRTHFLTITFVFQEEIIFCLEYLLPRTPPLSPDTAEGVVDPETQVVVGFPSFCFCSI
jgi:hypothetical protein